jgi:uncharacterized protein (UPF0333 family)
VRDDMKKYFNILRNDKGQSLVEFSLIIPIIVLMIMAIIEFGLMFNAYLTINNSSREGARYAAVGGTDAEIVAKIISTAPKLKSEYISVSIVPSEANRSRGETVTVYVTYDYKVLIPLMSTIIDNIVDLNAQTSMRVE